MKDKFDKFFNENNGKFVEVNDPSNYAQCMDLAYAWCDALGVTRDTIRNFYAYQVYTQPKDITLEHFELVPNTPRGLPEVGNLIVFSNKIGVAGHISIATGNGNLDSFETFDQNWGSDKKSRLVNHNYDAVLGWLRLRVKEEIVITDQTRIPQIENKEVQRIRSDLEGKDRRIYELEKEVDDYETNEKGRINEAVEKARAEERASCQSQIESANKVWKIDYETLLHSKVEKMTFWEFITAKLRG